MSLVNAYNFKLHNNITKYTYDLIGSNNGLSAGQNRPGVSAYGIEFLGGGHNSTTGDWGRMTFSPEDFQHTADDEFSILYMFKSSKLDAAYHAVFMMYDADANANRYGHIITPTETVNRYCYSTPTLSTAEGNCVGYDHRKSNVAVLANSQTSRTLSMNTVLYENNIDTTGSLYTVSCIPTIGAAKKGASWIWDAKMSINTLLHFNHKLSNAEISNYNSKLKGILI